MTEKQVETGDRLQVLVCAVGGRALGIDILRVQEVLRMVEITPFPKMPPIALGAINVRGRVVPVINLRHKLGMPDRSPDARTCIVLVRTGDQLLGFLVDEVSEVLEVPATHLEVPAEGPAWMRSDLFRGLGKLPGRLLVILEPDRLLSEQEGRLLSPPGGDEAIETRP